MAGGRATVVAALSGIYRTALYRFATTGEVPADFAGTDFQGAFRPQARTGAGGFGGGFGGSGKNPSTLANAGQHLGREAVEAVDVERRPHRDVHLVRSPASAYSPMRSMTCCTRAR